MKMRVFLLPACFLLLISCFETDEQVIPYPGEITTIADSVQSVQSYFDLESAGTVKSNRVSEWQLGFESAAEGWRVIVNSGADWFIYNTGSEDFSVDVNMPARLEGLYDTQNLWPDSTATGNWTLHENIYLLALYENGSFSRPIKVKFLNYSDSNYTFYYEDEIMTDTVTLLKDPQTNFSYYSFSERIQVYPEPDNDEYDLLFTSYYDRPTLFGQTIPYKVAGILLNIWNTAGAIDSVHSFGAITIETAATLNFSRKRDFPGYNWKDVVVDITGGGTATYNVKTHYNYVIHTAQGNYFKLRFLSYTLDGRSGFPRFEFSRLELE